MELRTNALLFPATRNTGPVFASTTISFARAVERAVAAITGYSATYENRSDHHLGKLDIELTTRLDPSDNRNVIVEGAFALRDWSGTWDDTYSGTVQIAILADLVPVTPPMPGDSRGDLVITDAEITQGIQHFRSALHLDSANVFPDNSIRLVEGKPAGIRLWVDYDQNSGLARISVLTGSLIVRDAAGIQTTITPLNSVVPKREIQIARGMANDTLNFVIPENLCSGAVSITARVWSVADPSAFSVEFQRTLQFETMVPVRVFAVGINYTGPDVNVGMPTGAPTAADFVALFGDTELLYPIPQVMQTGFMTMDYNGEMDSDISKGCDKMGDLRDDIADLRGDSTDIFYGLLNTGVNTGSVGGCGGGGGAGVGIIGGQGTAAHELGHILGRNHAPCDNVTRCARPLNTDGGYPVYSGFNSDSIGEFGFNTTTGAVLQPGNAHDLMGYSGNAWISPYTYKALMTRIPADNGGVAGGAPVGVTLSRTSSRFGPIEIRERIPKSAEHLFLSFQVQRDRSVEWRTAFHFPTGPQSMFGPATKFMLELRDERDRVIASHCLHQSDPSCGCGGESCVWPKKFTQAVPYDVSAARLVILDCDTVIYEEKIPDPPKVWLKCREAENRESKVVRCEWGAECEGTEASPLLYLLQWRDRRGVWRGVTPRTERTEWDVPKSLWVRGGFTIALRVLVSSGIATGMAVCETRLENGRDKKARGPRRVTISVADIPSKGPATMELPPILRATVLGSDGTASVAGEIGWFGEKGGQYGRGRSLQLSALPFGVHVLRASVANGGEGNGEASWLIERTRDNRYFVHRGTITYPDANCPPDSVKATREPPVDPSSKPLRPKTD